MSWTGPSLARSVLCMNRSINLTGCIYSWQKAIHLHCPEQNNFHHCYLWRAGVMYTRWEYHFETYSSIFSTLVISLSWESYWSCQLIGLASSSPLWLRYLHKWLGCRWKIFFLHPIYFDYCQNRGLLFDDVLHVVLHWSISDHSLSAVPTWSNLIYSPEHFRDFQMEKCYQSYCTGEQQRMNKATC